MVLSFQGKKCYKKIDEWKLWVLSNFQDLNSSSIAILLKKLSSSQDSLNFKIYKIYKLNIFFKNTVYIDKQSLILFGPCFVIEVIYHNILTEYWEPIG